MKQFGLMVVAGVALLVLLMVWRNAHAQKEFSAEKKDCLTLAFSAPSTNFFNSAEINAEAKVVNVSPSKEEANSLDSPVSTELRDSSLSSKNTDSLISNSSALVAEEAKNNSIKRDVLRYEVRPGDSYGKISEYLFNTVRYAKAIQDLNGVDPLSLRPGMILNIPVSEGRQRPKTLVVRDTTAKVFTYKVAPRDTLSEIAEKYLRELPIEKRIPLIRQLNPSLRNDLLREGQELHLPLLNERH